MREIDLSGSWTIRADPENSGLKAGWAEQSWSGRGVECPVPSAWQHTLGLEYHGVAWYRRRAKAGPIDSARDRVWLRFEAVATDCRVWVNGKSVGRHVGDYLPFEFDVTDQAAAAQDGEVEVTVRIDEIKGDRPKVVGKDPWRGHITKGFHDVVSLQHGGLWEPVTLRRTGRAAIAPNGVWAEADAASGNVTAHVEFQPGSAGGTMIAEVFQGGQAGAEPIATAQTGFLAGAPEAIVSLEVPDPHRWSPSSPHLYTLAVRVIDEGAPQDETSDEQSVRFGFRTIETGGPDNRQILLNGQPLNLRGVLDWGHEPATISPAPPPDLVRRRFAELRRRGFNCVCLCMWYPPEYFFDLADEMGMLLWQEHPVWKSDMADEHVAEYKRLFGEFFRRDRRHTCVMILSATCEHERFHPELEKWWWAEARRRTPGFLHQIQTGFMGWTDLSRTDLYDEHPYEPCGRWVDYLRDMQDELSELDPKPFVMGESIVFTSWPRTEELLAAAHGAGVDRLWWHPRGLQTFAQIERHLRERHGERVVERARALADRHHLLGRKFEYERYREYPNHAGMVMNNLRDVPSCQCGFIDDLDDWRFEADEFRSWWNDAPIILATPEQRRGLPGGHDAACRIGLSNFGPADFDGSLSVEVHGSGAVQTPFEAPICARRGEVAWGDMVLAAPRVDAPSRIRVSATGEGLDSNWWDLWALPDDWRTPRGVARLEAKPYTDDERAPIFEEKKFSSGWGIRVRDWRPYAPDPESLIPEIPAIADGHVPNGARGIVTHRLTADAVEFASSGGRVVLLASRAGGQPPTSYTTFYGQIPVFFPGPIFEDADAAWMVDLFVYDLTRRCTRSMPVTELGIAESVDPIVRLLNTHDQKVPNFMDMAFAARIGDGAVLISCLDHTEPAGRYVLRRMADWAGGAGRMPEGRLEPDVLRQWSERVVTAPAD